MCGYKINEIFCQKPVFVSFFQGLPTQIQYQMDKPAISADFSLWAKIAYQKALNKKININKLRIEA